MLIHKEGDYVRLQHGHYHKCPMCSKEFCGRKNRKFCSPLCKVKYNNDLALTKPDPVRDYAKILRKCRAILEEYYPLSNGEKAIPPDLLGYKGFDFTSQTKRIKRSQDGKEFFLVVDYAYLVDKNGVIIWKP